MLVVHGYAHCNTYLVDCQIWQHLDRLSILAIQAAVAYYNNIKTKTPQMLHNFDICNVKAFSNIITMFLLFNENVLSKDKYCKTAMFQLLIANFSWDIATYYSIGLMKQPRKLTWCWNYPDHVAGTPRARLCHCTAAGWTLRSPKWGESSM